MTHFRIELPSFAIETPSSLLDDIAALSMKGFSSSAWGGAETGGVFFGTSEAGIVRLVAWRALPCEHAEGPAFSVSTKDEAGLKQLLEHAKDDPELNGLEPAGWYHSVYGDLAITRKDAAIQDRYFPDPWKPLALIRRVKGEPATVAFYLREKNVVLRR